MASGPVFAVTAVAACLLPCGNAHNLRSFSKSGIFSYDYAHGGQDWVIGACASRQRQSPINFDDLMSPPTGKLSYTYSTITSPVEVANNGHTFAANGAGLGWGGITYEDAWYNLETVNVHARSEHTFGLQHTPLELHLVHKKFDSDALLVVAIPINCAMPPMSFVEESVLTNRSVQIAQQASTKKQAKGTDPAATAAVAQEFASAAAYVEPAVTEPNFNPALQMFLKVAPPSINNKAVNRVSEYEPVDLNMLLQGGTFLEYAGSLTAPPCAEIVTWFVRREPIMAADIQVHYLHDSIYFMTGQFGNARSTMPLNGRSVAVRQAVKEEPPPREPEQEIPLGPNPRTDREFRAMKWARDALKIAKSSTDYIRDLDFRLRAAAQAHADALTPNLIPELLPTPPPIVGKEGGPAPSEMAATAASMTTVIAGAAKEAIAQASKQIAVEVKAAAIEAAKEAAKVVKEGLPPPHSIIASAAPAR